VGTVAVAVVVVEVVQQRLFGLVLAAG
jgi:hypothetical protein